MVDFGDDALTRGRAHPMIDPSLRDQRLARRRPTRAVGARAAGRRARARRAPRPGARAGPGDQRPRRRGSRSDSGRELAVVVSLTGTTGDPQGRDDQARRLAAAGADVYLSNAAAARAAADLRAVTGARRERRCTGCWTTAPSAVVTAGVDLLADALRAQAVHGPPRRLATAAGRTRDRPPT